jgi:hypothetical protein
VRKLRLERTVILKFIIVLSEEGANGNVCKIFDVVSGIITCGMSSVANDSCDRRFLPTLTPGEQHDNFLLVTWAPR